VASIIGCLPTQALVFLAVFDYETHITHETQAIAFEWKPGLNRPRFIATRSLQQQRSTERHPGIVSARRVLTRPVTMTTIAPAAAAAGLE